MNTLGFIWIQIYDICDELNMVANYLPLIYFDQENVGGNKTLTSKSWP